MNHRGARRGLAVGVALGLMLPLVVARPASAIPPASSCSLSTGGTTVDTPDGTYLCRSYRDSHRRLKWRWERRSSGTESCLSSARSGWRNGDPSYWQGILTSKTSAPTLQITSGFKSIVYGDHTLLYSGVFDGTGRGNVTGHGTIDLEMAAHVEGSDIVVDQVRVNVIHIELTIGGQTKSFNTTDKVSPGQHMPFQCTSTTLLLQELGADGRAVQTKYSPI